MPALAKPPARLPRFVPHNNPQMSSGATAGAGIFFTNESNSTNSENTATAEKIDRLAHDARNVLSSLLLYGELLASPGILAPQHDHYALELQSIAKTTTQIIEALLLQMSGEQSIPALPAATHVPLPAVPVTDAAEELRHLQPLLAAIAGPAIQLSVATMPCPGRTPLAVENLTRVLINLVRNAADAMPSGGHIRVTAQYGDGFSFFDSDHDDVFGPPRSIVITVSDDGPGVPESLRERIFETGFSTRHNTGGWPAPRRRGLGLSNVRNLVEAAGGTVCVTSAPTRGARFEIHLPITSGTYAAPQNGTIALTPVREGA